MMDSSSRGSFGKILANSGLLIGWFGSFVAIRFYCPSVVVRLTSDIGLQYGVWMGLKGLFSCAVSRQSRDNARIIKIDKERLLEMNPSVR